jgi:pimeloyl-ACP methyl ester carboxylesterase
MMQMAGREHHYRSDDGLRLFYREFGESDAKRHVLCLPGLTRNSRDFEPLAWRLASGCRVLCPDLRGRGYSDYDPEWRNYHPATYVADAWRLLDMLGIERCAVIGTSLGGLMSMLMAGESPQRLAGVVLNDVGCEVAEEGLARIAGYVGKLPPVSSWDEAAAQAREVNGVAAPDLDDADWLVFARRIYREDEQGIPRLDMDANIGRALAEVGGTLADPWELFDDMRMPVLEIRGALSDILTRDILDEMKARKPELEVIEVANRGHAPLLDEPEALAAIDAFLDSLEY